MNAKTGFWSAFGALVGGAAGAYAGKYAVQMRPRYSDDRRPAGVEVEDAMVVGGAAGATVGAFLGGSLAGGEETPQLPK